MPKKNKIREILREFMVSIRKCDENHSISYVAPYAQAEAQIREHFKVREEDILKLMKKLWDEGAHFIIMDYHDDSARIRVRFKRLAKAITEFVNKERV